MIFLRSNPSADGFRWSLWVVEGNDIVERSEHMRRL